MAKIDLTGQRFGKLLVLEEVKDRRASNGAIIWRCKCDCGKEVEVVGTNLRKKKNPTTSCGCKTNSKDLTGKKFGKLTVLEPTDERINGKIVWKCQCDCGNIHYVNTGNLTSGGVKSCGKCNQIKQKQIAPRSQDLTGQRFLNWLVLEYTGKIRNRYKVYKCQCTCGNIEEKTTSELKRAKGGFCEKCRTKNLIGQRFSCLVVKEYKGRDSFRKTLWNCQCDCGNEIIVSSANLQSGNTKSCGCLKESSGEKKIREILEQNQIVFESQKTFNSCRFSDSNALARFDFYLPDYNLIIEYDGIQHFKQRSDWEPLEKIQERDKIKTQWCLNNHIRLNRISYKEYNDLTLERILNPA